MLENVKNLLSDGVTALGGILIVFGLVNLGLTIKDGMQGGGGQLSGALPGPDQTVVLPCTSRPVSTGVPSRVRKERYLTCSL